MSSWLASLIEVKGIILYFRQGCGFRLITLAQTQTLNSNSVKNFEESTSLLKTIW